MQYPYPGWRNACQASIEHSFKFLDGTLLADRRARPVELILLEVSGEGNPRASFDLNLYPAGLRMAEIYPLIVRMGRFFNIEPTEPEERSEGVKTNPLGHLSGGIDREGRDFLTVYFEDRRPRGFA